MIWVLSVFLLISSLHCPSNNIPNLQLYKRAGTTYLKAQQSASVLAVPWQGWRSFSSGCTVWGRVVLSWTASPSCFGRGTSPGCAKPADPLQEQSASKGQTQIPAGKQQAMKLPCVATISHSCLLCRAGAMDKTQATDTRQMWEAALAAPISWPG